jgi:hypothetical protein
MSDDEADTGQIESPTGQPRGELRSGWIKATGHDDSFEFAFARKAARSQAARTLQFNVRDAIGLSQQAWKTVSPDRIL